MQRPRVLEMKIVFKEEAGFTNILMKKADLQIINKFPKNRPAWQQVKVTGVLQGYELQTIMPASQTYVERRRFWKGK